MANAKQAFEIFCSALEFESADEQDTYVIETCGENSELLAEVRDLLKSNRESEGFLEDGGAAKSLIGTVDDNTADSIHEEVGSKIGQYKLLQKIGEGGFGVVFMAEQVQPVSRKVALKIIKLGMDTKEVIARFEAERQALAMMDHPNIARIFDAGATATGRPYFVMELVQGLPITEYCNRTKSTKQERLDLFTAVCHAIESAHLKGIIHRDIKPTNVLVTLDYGQPTVKVIDFGVAKATNQKLTEKTLFTRFGAMVGTPTYMSPEQAEMTSIDVDRRTDVYSLGVLLYELLTGTTPFSEERLRTAGFAEMQRIIAAEDPELPSSRVSSLWGACKKPGSLGTLARESTGKSAHATVVFQTKPDELKGDLDWITLKCLEKDRRRRYDTASAIVNVIRRHLDQETVSAAAPSLVYQFSKFYQRNKLLAQMLTLVLATLVIGLATTTWQWMTAENERASAVDARKLADEKSVEAQRQSVRAEKAEAEAKVALEQTSEALYTSSLAIARLEIENRKAPEAIAALERAPEKFRGWEWDFLKLRTSSQLLKLTGHTSWVYKAKFSPDGRLIASTGGGNPFWRTIRKQTPGEIIIWDAYTGQRLRTLKGHKFAIPDIAFSPDGKTLASASDTVRLWDVQTGKLLKEYGGTRSNAVAFSPDGKILAADQPRRLMLWNLIDESSKELPIPKSFEFGAMRFHNDSSKIYAVPFNQGRIIEVDVVNGKIKDLSTATVAKGALAISNYPVATAAEFATLAIAASDGKGLAEFYTSGQQYTKTDLHNSHIFGVDFHPTFGGHRRLATGSMDSTIRLHGGHDIDNFLLGHADRVLDVDFSPLGDRIVSTGSDGTVRVWDTSTNLGSGDVPLPRVGDGWIPDRVESIVFRKDNGRIAVARHGQAFSIDASHTPWHANYTANPGDPYMQEPMRFDPDGNVLVGCQDKIIHCWEFPSFEKRLGFRAHDKAIWLLTCDRDANKIASVAHLQEEEDSHSELKVWNGKTGELLYTLDETGTVVDRMVFSPEGKLLVVACRVSEFRELQQNDPFSAAKSSKSVIKLLDAQTGKLLKTLDEVQDKWMGICFDSKGILVAAAGTLKKSVLVWNTETGEYKESKQGLRDARDIAFHPNGSRLAMVSRQQTKVLDAETLRELLTLQSHGQKGYGGAAINARVCWSHDGYSLAVGSNSLSIWRVPSPEDKATPIDEVMKVVQRRAISRRLRLTEDYALSGRQPDRARSLLESLSSIELRNTDQYRIRAGVYARLGMDCLLYTSPSPRDS